MKTIMKTSLIAIALFIGLNLSAQDNPISFGVKAGVNLSNFSGSGVENSDAKVGFNVGLTMDYALSTDLYLLTGLEFTTKGAKSEYSDTEGGVAISYTNKANPMYIQMPVHLGYKLPVGEGTKIVFHAGPYVAYGIAGKLKVEGKASVAGQNVSASEDADFFSDDAFKNFDYGVGLGVGAEFGKIGVGLGYDLGLANISRTSDAKVKNMNASLTLGYKF